ncbi:hypothetical protein CLG94_08490 [Candidatus Methylomirabilis limnetica]|uniref:Helix-turn-helix domain-containing protein n=1 Tax=Candidatus Methylomirabilis limnetica TaxID=2033718 RepID=A0A2T4TXD8_9BACT|nr:MEDS domain-containing protein [Candidatus Methylomirabilis limnetica]PTL35784.1 hypothetical protein CLG94_08490 [Candidatus Methylomirabilis limnetica]
MSGGHLLNTKEAAKFLGVSEASVRRWTDAGTLPCQRIGGRRERRFTKGHLLLFLKEGERPTVTFPVRRDLVMIEGMDVRVGSHFCNLYSNDEGRARLAIPFLKDGLESDQTCFLLATLGAQREMLRELEREGVDVKEAMERHQLIVASGFPGAKQALAYFEKAFNEALKSRPGHVRLVGDMTWGLQSMPSVKELMDFEMRLNLFAKRFPMVAICQYDVRRFNGVAILHVLKCHPDVFGYHFGRFLN